MTDYNDFEFEWEGVIAYLDTPTIDGRFISSSGFRAKIPSVVRLLKPAKWPGINPAIVGKILHTWLDGTKVMGLGVSSEELTGAAVPNIVPRVTAETPTLTRFRDMPTLLVGVTFGAESAWANHEPITCKPRQPLKQRDGWDATQGEDQ